MPALTITQDLDATPWNDLRHAIPNAGTLERVGRLPKGMQSGESSVALAVRLGDGTQAIVQTSMALFLGAAQAFTVREEMDKPPTPVPQAAPPPQPAPAVAPVGPGLTTDHADPALHQTKPNGQNEKYVVLSEEERGKGFIRPVRTSYVHNNCGAATTMGNALAETYARDPKFYGSTYCSGCRAHHPVNQFTWQGTTELVGS